MKNNMVSMDDLKIYDGKYIRIIDGNGDAFDGIACYNCDEYNEHEYGRREDSLQIESFQFYRSYITTIQSLEEYNGPYGHFPGPYSKLEELTVEDGIEGIRDMLFLDDDEQVIRLLRCLDDYIDNGHGCRVPGNNEIAEALEELLKTNPGSKIREEAEMILNRKGE